MVSFFILVIYKYKHYDNLGATKRWCPDFFEKHKKNNFFSRFEHNSLIVSYTKITNESFGRQINITPGEERRTIWLHTPNRSKSSNGTK